MLAYDKQTLSGAIEILSQSELPDKFEGMKLYGSPEEAKDELCQDCKIFRLSNETGYGRITVYQVFPGIELYYNDISEPMTKAQGGALVLRKNCVLFR